jgi:hypothetical protein
MNSKCNDDLHSNSTAVYFGDPFDDDLSGPQMAGNVTTNHACGLN